jgi:hypothetical protein
MARPIFIVGKNRSGTKWLSNILLNHPNISGIQSDYHRGILETNLFNNMPKNFGNLKDNDNFIGFVECFSATDFFKISGLEKKMLYTKRPENYYDFFRYVMDQYTERKRTKYWLQKIHPFSFREIYENYKDALFIIIERDIINNIRSAYVLQQKMGFRPNIFREVVIYNYCKKSYGKYLKEKNIMLVSYKHLMERQELALKHIYDFLSIEGSEDMQDVIFERNTSFRNDSEKSIFYEKQNVIVIHILDFLLNTLPLFLYDSIYKPFKRLKQTNKKFVAGTFSMVCEENGFDKVEY